MKKVDSYSWQQFITAGDAVRNSSMNKWVTVKSNKLLLRESKFGIQFYSSCRIIFYQLRNFFVCCKQIKWNEMKRTRLKLHITAMVSIWHAYDSTHLTSSEANRPTSLHKALNALKENNFALSILHLKMQSLLKNTPKYRQKLTHVMAPLQRQW